MGAAKLRATLGLAMLVTAACRDPARDAFPVAESASCSAAAPVESCSVAPAASECTAAGTVDVASLLAEMTDLAALARRDCVRFRTVEASSYDRSSAAPQPPADTAQGWYANHDWGNYAGSQSMPGGRVESVLLDVDGPGAIVRMWTANGDGTLRVYFDGAAEPTLAAGFSDLLSGRVPPFVEPFAAENSTGRNLDFPLPFRRHVRVTVDGAASAFYYQVFHRRYPPGTDVVTFALDQLTPTLLEAAAAALDGAPASDAGEDGCEAASSRRLVLTADPGGSEITELAVFPGDLDADTLRLTVLSLTFDGHETARVPLGDFFGAGPGFLPHRTLPVEVSEGGTFTSRFVMPFACSAVVAIESPPGKTAALRVRHRAAPFTSDSLYFAAHWIARGPIATRPFRDLPLAAVEGAGRYVGTLLAVDSRVGDWWGEGDEKIWVDDDGFPSWFGTGTEDYFGYANASSSPFDHPLRVLRRTGSARGQVSNARFHLLDSIPFESSLTFNLELWHWNPAAMIHYDTLAYFYVAPDAQDVMPF